MKRIKTESMTLVATLLVNLIGWSYLVMTLGSKLANPIII